MEKLISESTKRNWERLGASPKGRLSSRANKTKSKKRILPVEYLSPDVKKSDIEKIAELIESLNITKETAIYSIGINLLRRMGIYDRPHVQRVLCKYNIEPKEALMNCDLPMHQRDILGILYQCMLSEGTKNRFGAYYTPKKTVISMLKSVELNEEDLFLDPCCGSGSFFLEADLPPNNIFGVDKDPTAVMIAKINMLLKYKNEEFEPQIYCASFLKEVKELKNIRFSRIVTNPPWGALCGENKSDSFSAFFCKSFDLLKEKGKICFLFPVSFLNVRSHRDLRRFMLENANIKAVGFHKEGFRGVLTKTVHICAEKSSPQNESIEVYINDRVKKINPAAFRLTQNYGFCVLEDIDLKIINKAKEKGKISLNDSIWGMGIVTGNNKKALSDIPKEGFEPIYTGKDIRPYELLEPKRYINYDPASLQQTANEKLYRKEKLVYKFIGQRPVFALEDKGRLLLNSANFLIPKTDMPIRMVLAFFNSDFAAYFYKMVFGEIKILKNNLLKIPIPFIPESTALIIDALVRRIENGEKAAHGEIQRIIYDLFEFSVDEIAHIERVLCSKPIF